MRSRKKTNSPEGPLGVRPRTIGLLAKEAGVNVETIRFYERRGLLIQPKSPPAGWRIYDPSAVWILHYIKLGRQLGFTLSEMKTLLAKVGGGRSFCQSMQQAYEGKIQLLGEKIDQMRRMRRDLRKALADCIKQSASGSCPIAERCSAQLIVPLGPSAVRRQGEWK